MESEDIRIDAYSYDLPEHRIAHFPVEPRDHSRLLLYRNRQMSDRRFFELPGCIPPGSLMIFNNSRVIHARLLFATSTGAQVEVFCLEPSEQGNDRKWNCLVGNLKKWREPFLEKTVDLPSGKVQLRVQLLQKKEDCYEVEFLPQTEGLLITDVIEHCGLLPLPPYIKRMAEKADEASYQTVYAGSTGSVAAPTAGLHFTPAVLDALSQKNITQAFLTLHVGAGTFAPVKAETMKDHVMHSERIVLHVHTLNTLISKADEPFVVVGTTSMRSMETLYRLGVKMLDKHFRPQTEWVSQWESYKEEKKVSRRESLESIRDYMLRNGLETIEGTTRIMIAPGFDIRMADAIVTNFHQPKSTLLLLIAAMIGEEWKEVYRHALENEYRFLSYGDSSLLFKHAL
jgi:S-adenosylmethionine:tRNA ribosyltransferase-isomerase